MIIDGVGKKAEVTEHGVRIVPTAMIGPKETIEIPFEAIVMIRSQAASWFSRGWVHFATSGSPSGAFSVPYTQPNAVIFKRSQQAAFDEFKRLVQERMSALRKS